MLKCVMSGSQVKGAEAFLAFLCKKGFVGVGTFPPSSHFLTCAFMPKGQKAWP